MLAGMAASRRNSAIPNQGGARTERLLGIPEEWLKSIQDSLQNHYKVEVNRHFVLSTSVQLCKLLKVDQRDLACV